MQHDGTEYRWAVAYNDNRQPHVRTDPLGNTVTTTRYGTYHLPEAVQWSGPDAQGSSPQSLTVSYDALGNPTARTLVRADGSRDEETFGFDRWGRAQSYDLTTLLSSGNTVTARLEWDYFAEGVRKAVRVGPEGAPWTATTYDYDPASRLTSAVTATSGGEQATSTFTWTPEGLPAQTVFGDGTTECRGYDAADRLTRIGHAYQTTACAADGTFAGTADPLRTFAYAYDGYANRNRLDETWVDPAGTARTETQTFAFDTRDRLAAAAYADEALSYAYDANGNRTHEHRYAPVTGWTAPDYLDQTAQAP